MVIDPTSSETKLIAMWHLLLQIMSSFMNCLPAFQLMLLFLFVQADGEHSFNFLLLFYLLCENIIEK